MKLLAVTQILVTVGVTAAFTCTPPFARKTSRSQLLGIKNGGNDDGDARDMDAKIRSLNRMIGVSDKENDILISTSKRRKNLAHEIELLSQLHPDNLMEESNPDAAENNIIQQFWSIWYGECGAANERVLRAFEEELVGGGPESWPDAEREYLALIEEHCQRDDELDLSLWIEPANRLATLYYMMGRLEDSKLWCEKILTAKPWHIGALSGIILVGIQSNDEETVRFWASKSLPRLSEETLGARSEWVEANVVLAQEKLYELDEASQTRVKTSNCQEGAYSTPDDIDDLSWQ